LVGVLINQIGGFLQVFLVLFMTHRGFTEVQAGVALGCYGAGAFAGVLVGGALADRLGPRWATLFSMGGFAVLLVVMLYVPSYPAVLGAVIAAGIVGRFYRPAAAALLSELTPQHRQVMMFALYRLATNVGTTLAPVLGALLIAVSYELLFWVDAITALGYGLIAACTLPGRPPRSSSSTAVLGTRRGYRAVFADRRFVLYLLAMFVNSAVYVQYTSVLPLAMTDAGLSIAWYGGVVSLNGFIVITCELLLTKVTQRQSSRLIVIAGFLLLGGGVSIYALPWRPAVFIIGTLVWTMAEIGGGPTMFAYPGRVAPEGLRARYIGAMQTMFNLGAAIGPVAGVAAFYTIGGNVWWCYGLVCLLGMGLALPGMRAAPTEAADERGQPVMVASAETPETGEQS
jgi:predicted MFS family arabinose efflux permease